MYHNNSHLRRVRSPDKSRSGSPLETDAIIIDAGGDPADMIKCIHQQELKPIYLFNTHGHIDHILGNPQIKKAFPKIKLCIHPADAPMLKSAGHNLSTELGFSFASPEPDKLVQEDDVTSFGSFQLRILHLPGHTKGGIGILYQPPSGQTPILFSGDAIFAGGVGRTDFPGGSMSELITNIRKKILSLPEETIIYPGHGESTTVGDEKRTNPFL
jgi:glyoxylase-like metal-dependent hydrolase (beta-lactamase superfamily II)